MKHILMAYDASKQADKAFDFAMELADKYKAALTILAVAPSLRVYYENEVDDVLKSVSNYFHHSFAHLQKKAEQHHPGVRIDFKIVDGSPAEEIVNQAEELDVDHIVMGHRGMTKFKRWLLGSVAKQVMIYAHCGVTVVR